MSQPPPPISYATPYASDNSQTLLKLAVVFNYISAGFDGLGILFWTGFGVFILWASSLPTPPGGTSGDPPPPAVVSIFYFAMGLFSIAAGVVKLVGARQVQKRAPHAWGWCLAAGIVGCVQFFCGGLCMIPSAAGVYTVIILCFERVRNCLAQGPAYMPPPP